MKKFVSREKSTSVRLYEQTPPGVAVGLAWTEMGKAKKGANLRIETALAWEMRAEPGSLEFTGNLGDAMKDSMKIAYTVAKNVLTRRQPDNEFLETAHIHLHIPRGAVFKDGPSAGCAAVSALLSLALNRPILQNIAIAGALSLHKILPVGGIKEKIIAAKCFGVERIILPVGNRADVEELDDAIKKDVTIDFASDYDQIYEILFP